MRQGSLEKTQVVGHLLLQCRELGIYLKRCLIMSKMYTMAKGVIS